MPFLPIDQETSHRYLGIFDPSTQIAVWTYHPRPRSHLVQAPPPAHELSLDAPKDLHQPLLSDL
uniref:Uncharacterized protein n=1 Tax=uncultured marine virus TaxID=186617 RepID=A0A0F7L5N2_9VIRU|nr:hypothetical protein [uncultured marine virus]